MPSGAPGTLAQGRGGIQEGSSALPFLLRLLISLKMDLVFSE